MKNFRNYEEEPITIGELKTQLSIYPDNMEIYFEGFYFSRVKQRGENQLQIELLEKENEDK